MSATMTTVAQGIVDAALAETKAWLRIETGSDDVTLAALLRSAIGMAEDFCGQMLFVRAGTEVLSADSAWRRLRTCPVRSIIAARALSADGSGVALAADAWAMDISGDGDGWIRTVQPGTGRIEIDLTAGLATDWTGLPDALRHGIVRLAAHLFVERDNAVPAPAIVTALWRPWRRMRLQ